MENTKHLNWTKITAGCWEARVGAFEDDRYLAEKVGGEWFLTYPGWWMPDSVFDTLRECKLAVAEHS